MTPFHLLPEVLSDVDFAPAKATEPAKQWRNWWRVNERFKSSTTGKWRDVGEVYAAPVAWPSLEVAEQKAFETITMRKGHGGSIRREMDTYLGAFREGEQP